jgi:hypothetical protein
LKSINFKAFDFKNVLKSSVQLEDELFEYLQEDKIKDPVMLYGKLFKGSYDDFLTKIS